MSEYENSDHDIPRFEPWLGIMASSLLPVFIALFLPARFFLPLVGATVALFAAALVLLRRHPGGEP